MLGNRSLPDEAQGFLNEAVVLRGWAVSAEVWLSDDFCLEFGTIIAGEATFKIGVNKQVACLSKGVEDQQQLFHEACCPFGGSLFGSNVVAVRSLVLDEEMGHLFLKEVCAN